jgi:hypothetical protein
MVLPLTKGRVGGVLELSIVTSPAPSLVMRGVEGEKSEEQWKVL